MWIRHDIAQAIETTRVEVRQLGGDEVLATFEHLEGRFAHPGPNPLWERLKNIDERYFGTEELRRVRGFSTDPALMLVRDSQGSCGFEFLGGRARC